MQATSANSPAISDRTRFPLTMQTYPGENDINPGRVGFIQLMKWKKVAIVFHDIEYFREVKRVHCFFFVREYLCYAKLQKKLSVLLYTNSPSVHCI